MGSTWSSFETIKIVELQHGLGIGIIADTPIGNARITAGKSFYFVKIQMVLFKDPFYFLLRLAQISKSSFFSIILCRYTDNISYFAVSLPYFTSRVNHEIKSTIKRYCFYSRLINDTSIMVQLFGHSNGISLIREKQEVAIASDDEFLLIDTASTLTADTVKVAIDSVSLMKKHYKIL